ncbi:hypothetical protein EVAR_52043_1 [Eumeta japonica]|uniref:Uncharacterized protein n=1 Tax=Eumeta variegata TaxID=151549 RepID=A0A4C1Z7E8_EUMVA|nr:hypothetical protein EVAR_52043_1 [Eumeta japonica]
MVDERVTRRGQRSTRRASSRARPLSLHFYPRTRRRYHPQISVSLEPRQSHSGDRPSRTRPPAPNSDTRYARATVIRGVRRASEAANDAAALTATVEGDVTRAARPARRAPRAPRSQHQGLQVIKPLSATRDAGRASVPVQKNKMANNEADGIKDSWFNTYSATLPPYVALVTGGPLGIRSRSLLTNELNGSNKSQGLKDLKGQTPFWGRSADHCSRRACVDLGTGRLGQRMVLAWGHGDARRSQGYGASGEYATPGYALDAVSSALASVPVTRCRHPLR